MTSSITFIQPYSKQLQELTDLLNTEVKWNFVARYSAQQSMATIDNNRFFQWIKTTNQSFEESSSSPFAAPEKVSACFAKVHQLARNILSSQDKQHDKNLEALVNTFKKQSAQIQCFAPTETIKIADALLGHISRVTRCTLSLNPQEKLLLVNNFNNLFRVTTNQKLRDEDIEAKIKSMFEILENNPKIAPTALACHLDHLWYAPQKGDPKTLTDLSEFLVKYNPYNMTLQDILKEFIEHRNPKNLIGKSLIYRLPNHNWGMKIEQLNCLSSKDDFTEIEVISPEKYSATLKINRATQAIVALSFDRFVTESLETWIQRKDDVTSFQIEPQMVLQLGENPFETDQAYTLQIQQGLLGGWFNKKPFKDYIFTPLQTGKDRLNAVIFHVLEGGQAVGIESPKYHKALQQNWVTYQSFFSVVTCQKETYTIQGTEASRLDTCLLSLSTRPLKTEGMVKQTLKERDKAKAQLLEKLINNQSCRETQQAFKCINEQCETPLPDELFETLFNQDGSFHRLCTNQYVKEKYAVGEDQCLTSNLKNRVAKDLLHEAQFLILSRVGPKAQSCHQDLIQQLCQAAKLTEAMNSVFAIPFIGPTGSGKSATVSYMMGVPMEEFEDEFGEIRIRHKKAAYDTIPKIGFALGISETLHAKTFSLLPPPPFEPDPYDPFEPSPIHDPKFSAVLTRETLKLADFPGFFDTRGTHYEIITNFSIDRAMEAFKGVPAIVQVLPYENITVDRARLLHSTLIELEAKFPALLTDEKLQERIHFVITKFGQIGKNHIQARLEQLVNEYRQDGLSGKKYFSFLLHQLLQERVHLLNPLSSTARLDILDKIIEKFESAIEEQPDCIQKNYKGGFNNTDMQLMVGEVLEEGIFCCQNLLEGFLNKKREMLLKGEAINRLKQIVLVRCLEQEKASTSALLESLKDSIKTLKHAIENLETEKQEEEEAYKKHAVSIRFYHQLIEKTYDCLQCFQPVGKEGEGDLLNENRVEILHKYEKFVTLYKENIQQIKADIEVLIG